MVTNNLIPHLEVDEVYNPIGDGNCGFRALAVELFGDERKYLDIKDAMLRHYLTNIGGIYKSYDQHRIKGILNPHSNEWFCVPECAQIASDTFKAPIAFYGFESNTFFPLQLTPFESKRTHPIALHLHHAHIILVKIKHDACIQWPELYYENRGRKREVLTVDPWYPLFKDVFDRSIQIYSEVSLPGDADVQSICSSDPETLDLTN